jgi:hypothetical protein
MGQGRMSACQDWIYGLNHLHYITMLGGDEGGRDAVK